MGVEVDETRLVDTEELVVDTQGEGSDADSSMLTWFGCYTTTYHFGCNAGLTTMDVIVGFPA